MNDCFSWRPWPENFIHLYNFKLSLFQQSLLIKKMSSNSKLDSSLLVSEICAQKLLMVCNLSGSNRQRVAFIETGFETLSLVIPLCSFLCTSNHDQLLWDDTAAVVMWIQKMIHAIVISDIALLPENIST